ncbi:MAG: enoyl-CoA hydratase/isomerase family protein [Phycisphaerae bacterium]|nr:enoyl-CoA hydratase-related protein [Phycisphaerae bacterium]NUQ46068.1 enoyl-CoA hydratase/isomerase family protein [Phycisphaerae bacterium]
MADYTTLLLDRRPDHAVVRLNRPDKRNALSPQLIADLQAALTALERDEAIRSIILTGEGQAFSAGLDLEILRDISTTRTREENLADSKNLADLFLRIHRHPKPIIAAVNGPAVAGGCGLATVCDFTIASDAARFGYTEVRIGFVAAIVSIFLLRIVGEKTTRDLMLTGRIITAAEAHALGLVGEVVPPPQLLERAADLARQLTENSPNSLAATKRLISSIPGDGLEADLRRACELNAHVRMTPDCREGVSAFLEKRKPDWATPK